MARLVVKRTPWWVAHKKWVMVVLPLATLQAATLAGFGYFYHRLDSLEQQGDNVAAFPSLPPPQVPMEPLATTQQDVPEMGNASGQHQNELALVSEPMMQVPDKPEPVSEAKPEKKPVEVGKKEVVRHPAAKVVEKVSKERVVEGKHKAVAVPVEKKQVDLTALANRSGLQRSEPVRSAASGKPGVWVYLGELRDYGWYGQMLHISPTSGLPEAGRSYQAQYIQRVYASPYGKVVDGQFHLGEWVYLHEVVRGRKNDVWGRVSPR
jgi:outer membrane biosynthesis protein TonB